MARRGRDADDDVTDDDSEFDKFEDLAKKLVQVPKKAVDELREKEKREKDS